MSNSNKSRILHPTRTSRFPVVSAIASLACGFLLGGCLGEMPEPEPEAPTTGHDEAALASGLSTVTNLPARAMRTSNGNIYFTAYTTSEFGDGTATVYRESKSDSPGQEIALYTETYNTNNQVMYSGITWANVGGVYYGYWVRTQGSTTIERVPLGGGARTTIAQSPTYASFSPLSTDGAFLYWTDGGGLRKVPIGGGAVTTLVTFPVGSQSLSIGLDNNYVYYANTGSVAAVSKAGGGSFTLASGSKIKNVYVYPAGNTTTVFFTDANAAVKSVVVGSPAVTTYSNGASGLDAQSVFYDGTRVLWATCNTGGPAANCKVWKYQSGAITTLASGLTGAYGLDGDAAAAYWVGDGIQRYTY